jgi:L-ascorbate metabolism protein UlaG (beta-lactamase superfamily)
MARLLVGLVTLFAFPVVSRAQSLQFTGIERLTNREILVKLSFPAGMHCRIDACTKLPEWNALATLQSTGVNHYVDSAAPYLGQRFYRAANLSGTAPMTGDHLATTNGDLVIHPINHASFVMSWNGKTIYNDPVGAATLYTGLPRADLILISHGHPDHFSTTTLNSVTGATCVIFAPQAVTNSMGAPLRALTTVMTNGASASALGIGIEAVPAYNANHPLGTGNGYVLSLGGKRIYIAGDTGDIPEMRALPDIDVAFVPMNLPYTMSVPSAASAVRQFRPKIVYPYHYSPSSPTSDVNLFKSLVGTDLGIEVRLRKWY